MIIDAANDISIPLDVNNPITLNSVTPSPDGRSVMNPANNDVYITKVV